MTFEEYIQACDKAGESRSWPDNWPERSPFTDSLNDEWKAPAEEHLN